MQTSGNDLASGAVAQVAGFWETISVWFHENGVSFAIKAGVAVLIVLIGWVAARILGGAVVRSIRHTPAARMSKILAKAVRISVIVVAVALALDQVGLDIKALLAAAGVLGLAVGFGAQTLVKDIISGFFLIANDVVAEGDVVETGSVTGVVEEVGFRITKIRSFNGQLWYIPNGEINSVGNYNRSWTRAIAQVGLAYEGDLEKGLKVLQEVGDEYARDHSDLVVEAPEAQGVLGLNNSDVGLRLIMKVQAGQQWAVERDLRKLIKLRFDAEDLEIPFPRHVVYTRKDDAA